MKGELEQVRPCVLSSSTSLCACARAPHSKYRFATPLRVHN